MRREYLDYKHKSMQEVFSSFSKSNQAIINDYINYCRKDAGENTLQKYFNKIVQIADITEKPLDKLVLKDVHNFLALLNTSNRGTDTINDVKKTLKRFIKWKYKGSKDFSDIDRDIKQKKKGSSERLSMKDLLTKEELESLIRGAESLRYKAMIFLMYESACRPEECYKLKWEDLDFKNKEVSLNSSKTKEARVVPIEESLIHLKRYYQEYPFPDVKQTDLVFPATDRTKPINNQSVNDYFKKLSLRTIKKHLNPYVFRHTRLQEIRSKLSVEAYEKIAGHSIEVALEHYGHLDMKDATKEMREKVLGIEELTPEEKDRVKILEKQLSEIQDLLSPELRDFIKKFQELSKDRKLKPVYFPPTRYQNEKNN